MSKIRISTDLSLPLEVAAQTTAILGLRGSGKTNTAGVMAESLLGQNLPIVVIDPTDAWFGLREKFPVFIFGGEHGDMPLTETDGKVLAEFVVHEQVPMILSMRHLRKAAQRRLVTEFVNELYHLKGKTENRTPLTVFDAMAVKLPPGERAVLVCCAQHVNLPGEGCTREQLTVVTGYKRSSRDAYIQRLKEKGFIETTERNVFATKAGMDALGPSFEPLPTGEDLQRYWLDRLPEGEKKVLCVLINNPPHHECERETISRHTNYKRSSRDAYIQRLKARQLVIVNGGTVKASPNLF